MSYYGRNKFILRPDDQFDVYGHWPWRPSGFSHKNSPGTLHFTARLSFSLLLLVSLQCIYYIFCLFLQCSSTGSQTDSFISKQIRKYFRMFVIGNEFDFFMHFFHSLNFTTIIWNLRKLIDTYLKYVLPHILLFTIENIAVIIVYIIARCPVLNFFIKYAIYTLKKKYIKI